jgi:hypothetical protein
MLPASASGREGKSKKAKGKSGRHPSSFILLPPPLWFDAIRRAQRAESGKNPEESRPFRPKERAQFGPFWAQFDRFWTQSVLG